MADGVLDAVYTVLAIMFIIAVGVGALWWCVRSMVRDAGEDEYLVSGERRHPHTGYDRVL